MSFDYRSFCGQTYVVHSAKGSVWEKHKYVKVQDGMYFYPNDYKGGRHIENFKKKAEKKFKKTLDKKEGKEVLKTRAEPIGDTKNKEKKKMSAARKEKINNFANDVINGKYGNGKERIDKLGKKYNRLQNRVNQILLGKAAAKRIRKRKRDAGLLGKKKG